MREWTLTVYLLSFQVSILECVNPNSVSAGHLSITESKSEEEDEREAVGQ